FYCKESLKVNIIREYVKGSSLEQLIERRMKTNKKFTEEQVWYILSQIIITLDFLSKSNKKYIDKLIPKNIFVTDKVEIKLRNCDISNDLLYGCKPTPTLKYYLYMSSEEYNQIRPLGVILYEMCTFTHPFQGPTSLSAQALQEYFQKQK